MPDTQRSTTDTPAKRGQPPLLNLDLALSLLSAEQQRNLCKAVITEAIGCDAEFRATPGDERKWRNVIGQASDLISSIIDATGLVPGDGSEKTSSDLAMPDLNGLGIRMCTACGCTEDYACPGSCWWAGETLCSNCQEDKPACAAPGEPATEKTDDHEPHWYDGIIRHTLETSTAHLQRGDRTFLEFASDPGPKDRIAAMVGPFGWLIATNTPRDQEGLSQNLSGIINRAGELGCAYVLFHVEGHKIVGLPTFPEDTEAVDD